MIEKWVAARLTRPGCLSGIIGTIPVRDTSSPVRLFAAYTEDNDPDNEVSITRTPEISSVPIRAVFAMPFHAAQSFEVSLETSRYRHRFTVRKGSS